MDTLESVRSREKSREQISRPLRVQVIDTRMLENKLNCIIADTTGFMKLIVDRAELYEDLKPSNYIILRNYIKGYACLFSTRSTTICKARGFDVPDTYVEQGKKQLRPEANLIRLADICDDHLQKHVNVEATIVGVRSKLVFSH